jgi:hypothetical protein
VVAAVKPLRKRGRPKKGEQPPPPEPTRLEHQAAMTLEQMLDDLPRACNVGSKKNSKGYKETWVGYKLHLGNLCAGARFCSGVTSDDFIILNQFLSEMWVAGCLFGLVRSCFGPPVTLRTLRGQPVAVLV